MVCILDGGDRIRRAGLVSVLAACFLGLNVLAAQPALADQGSPTGQCVTKQGPVGNPFVDCSGGQLFNIVPPGQTGTYDLTDFAKAKAGQGFPPHTRDQEPMYANLINVAPNLKAADISPTYYKDAGFLADLSKAGEPESILPAGTSCETPAWAVRMTPSPRVQCPATPA